MQNTHPAELGAEPVISRLSGRWTRLTGLQGLLTAILTISSVTVFGILTLPALGFRSVSILYLLAIICLPLFCARTVVLASAVGSALLWNFLFIPPRLTFTIGDLEDGLMFFAYFLAAFVGGFLVARLKANERVLVQRERRLTLLYDFTKAISGSRGVTEIIRLSECFFMERLDLSVRIEQVSEDKQTATLVQNGTNQVAAPGGDRLSMPVSSGATLLGRAIITNQTRGGTHTLDHELLVAMISNLGLVLEREQLAEANQINQMNIESVRLSRILINHVSHELRTPLTTIKGSVSGLLEGNTIEQAGLRSDLLSETLIATNRLDALVEDLLAMSRLEAGRLQIHPDISYLGELISLAQAGLGLTEGDMRITLHSSARNLEVTADPVLLVQVFRNLFRNFLMHAGNEASLTIDARICNQELIIRFVDNGQGVSKEELPYLFDTFYRGKKSGHGCGLGLSICRGLVEAHGGQIDATLTPDTGLTIGIVLPQKAAL